MWNRSPYYERLMAQLNNTDYETTGQWPSAVDIQEQEILEVDQEDRILGKRAIVGSARATELPCCEDRMAKGPSWEQAEYVYGLEGANWSDPRPVSWGGCPHTWGFNILCYIHYTKVAHSQPWSITNHSDAFLTHILFKLRSVHSLGFLKNDSFENHCKLLTLKQGKRFNLFSLYVFLSEQSSSLCCFKITTAKGQMPDTW